MNDSHQGEALLNGLDLTTVMVARHRIIIGPYLTKKPGLEDGIDVINEGLRRTTIKLYTRVLEYQAKAACYLNHGMLARLAIIFPSLMIEMQCDRALFESSPTAENTNFATIL